MPEISENPDVARAVLDATVELWEGEGFANGAIDEELWAIGYETMQRLGFIDGSVPLGGDDRHRPRRRLRLSAPRLRPAGGGPSSASPDRCHLAPA